MMDELQALGIAQAMYNAVKDEVSTSRPGNLRDAANQRLRDAFEASGGAIRSMDLVLNGETVGALTASKTEGIRVTDDDQLEAWLDEHGWIVHETCFKLSDLSEDELDELWAWARERWPEHVAESTEINEDWTSHVGHVGSDVIDADGEIIPGVEWATQCGTIRVTGCQMWPDPRKRSSKYADVSGVLGRMGLSATQALGLLGGDVS